MKRVAFNVPRKTATANADDWVQNARPIDKETKSGIVGTTAPHLETMKRFTIDVPEDLHRRIKMQCAMRGSKMADVLREMLEKEFPQS